MFEKVGQVAEQMVTRMSRRSFLGRFGGAALIAAAAVGGILAFPEGAMAGRRCSSDADCFGGQVCRSGHCVDHVPCDLNSSLACQGSYFGDGCIDGNFIGTCGAP